MLQQVLEHREGELHRSPWDSRAKDSLKHGPVQPGCNIDGVKTHALPIVLDPFVHGVAIGFKPLEPERAAKGEIDWVGRATLCESPGVLDPPSPAAPNGLDLVVLQLTQQLDGSPLAPDAVLIDLSLIHI